MLRVRRRRDPDSAGSLSDATGAALSRAGDPSGETAGTGSVGVWPAACPARCRACGFTSSRMRARLGRINCTYRNSSSACPRLAALGPAEDCGDDALRRFAVPELRHPAGLAAAIEHFANAVRMRLGSVPTTLLVPSVTVIGRSVFSRRVMQGTPSAVASSWMPPESVSTRRASPMSSSISR